MRLNSEYVSAFLPLALFFSIYIVLRATLTGRWRSVQIRPWFNGRFSYVMKQRYWGIGFISCLAWAVGMSLYIAMR